MDEDIKFLQDFLACDRYRITELIDDHISPSLQRLGQLLRRHFRGPFTILYIDENDTMYELIQLLDGNNFEVKYGFTYLTFKAAKVTPIYMETIEVQFECEQEPEERSATFSAKSATFSAEYDYKRIVESIRGLRAKMSLIDDISFNEKLFDEKPP